MAHLTKTLSSVKPCHSDELGVFSKDSKSLQEHVLIVCLVFSLVQDENAKIILLNVPLEDQPTPTTPSKLTSAASSLSSMSVTSKPPRRPPPSPRPGIHHLVVQVKALSFPVLS